MALGKKEYDALTEIIKKIYTDTSSDERRVLLNAIDSNEPRLNSVWSIYSKDPTQQKIIRGLASQLIQEEKIKAAAASGGPVATATKEPTYTEVEAKAPSYLAKLLSSKDATGSAAKAASGGPVVSAPLPPTLPLKAAAAAAVEEPSLKNKQQNWLMKTFNNQEFENWLRKEIKASETDRYDYFKKRFMANNNSFDQEVVDFVNNLYKKFIVSPSKPGIRLISQPQSEIPKQQSQPQPQSEIPKQQSQPQPVADMRLAPYLNKKNLKVKRRSGVIESGWYLAPNAFISPKNNHVEMTNGDTNKMVHFDNLKRLNEEVGEATLDATAVAAAAQKAPEELAPADEDTLTPQERKELYKIIEDIKDGNILIPDGTPFSEDRERVLRDAIDNNNPPIHKRLKRDLILFKTTGGNPTIFIFEADGLIREKQAATVQLSRSSSSSSSSSPPPQTQTPPPQTPQTPPPQTPQTPPPKTPPPQTPQTPPPQTPPPQTPPPKTPPPPFTATWQYTNDGGSSFTDLINDIVFYSNGSPFTINLKGTVPPSVSGQVTGNPTATVAGNVAQLTFTAGRGSIFAGQTVTSPSITIVPPIVPPPPKTPFTATWQYTNDGGTTFKDLTNNITPQQNGSSFTIKLKGTAPPGVLGLFAGTDTTTNVGDKAAQITFTPHASSAFSGQITSPSITITPPLVPLVPLVPPPKTPFTATWQYTNDGGTTFKDLTNNITPQQNGSPFTITFKNIVPITATQAQTGNQTATNIGETAQITLTGTGAFAGQVVTSPSIMIVAALVPTAEKNEPITINSTVNSTSEQETLKMVTTSKINEGAIDYIETIVPILFDELLRDKNERDKKVKCSEIYGFTIRLLTPEECVKFELDSSKNYNIITSMEAGSVASIVGLNVGDILIGVYNTNGRIRQIFDFVDEDAMYNIYGNKLFDKRTILYNCFRVLRYVYKNVFDVNLDYVDVRSVDLKILNHTLRFAVPYTNGDLSDTNIKFGSAYFKKYIDGLTNRNEQMVGGGKGDEGDEQGKGSAAKGSAAKGSAAKGSAAKGGPPASAESDISSVAAGLKQLEKIQAARKVADLKRQQEKQAADAARKTAAAARRQLSQLPAGAVAAQKRQQSTLAEQQARLAGQIGQLDDLSISSLFGKQNPVLFDDSGIDEAVFQQYADSAPSSRTSSSGSQGSVVAGPVARSAVVSASGGPAAVLPVSIAPGSPIAVPVAIGSPIAVPVAIGSPIAVPAVTGSPIIPIISAPAPQMAPGSQLLGQSAVIAPLATGSALPSAPVSAPQMATGSALPSAPVSAPQMATGSALTGSSAIGGPVISGSALPSAPVSAPQMAPGSQLLGQGAVIAPLATGSALPSAPVSAPQMAPGSQLLGQSAVIAPLATGSALPSAPVSAPQMAPGSALTGSSAIGGPVISGSSLTGSSAIGGPVVSGSALPSAPVSASLLATGSALTGSSAIGGPVISGSSLTSSSAIGGPVVSGSSLTGSSAIGGPVASGSALTGSSAIGGPVASSASLTGSSAVGGPVVSGSALTGSSAIGGPVVSGSALTGSSAIGGPVVSGSALTGSSAIGGPVVSGSALTGSSAIGGPVVSGSALTGTSAIGGPVVSGYALTGSSAIGGPVVSGSALTGSSAVGGPVVSGSALTGSSAIGGPVVSGSALTGSSAVGGPVVSGSALTGASAVGGPVVSGSALTGASAVGGPVVSSASLTGASAVGGPVVSSASLTGASAVGGPVASSASLTGASAVGGPVASSASLIGRSASAGPLMTGARLRFMLIDGILDDGPYDVTPPRILLMNIYLNVIFKTIISNYIQKQKYDKDKTKNKPPYVPLNIQEKYMISRPAFYELEVYPKTKFNNIDVINKLNEMLGSQLETTLAISGGFSKKYSILNNAIKKDMKDVKYKKKQKTLKKKIGKIKNKHELEIKINAKIKKYIKNYLENKEKQLEVLEMQIINPRKKIYIKNYLENKEKKLKVLEMQIVNAKKNVYQQQQQQQQQQHSFSMKENKNKIKSHLNSKINKKINKFNKIKYNNHKKNNTRKNY